MACYYAMGLLGFFILIIGTGAAYVVEKTRRPKSNITMIYEPNPQNFRVGDQIGIAGQCYTVTSLDFENTLLNVKKIKWYQNLLWRVKCKLKRKQNLSLLKNI